MASLWVFLDELEDELVAFCDPVCSLDEQNRRTVILEYCIELWLDDAELSLDDEPDAPPDWLELLPEDWLDELDDCS